MKKRKKRRPLRWALRVLLAMALAALFLLWDNTALQVTEWAPAFPDLPEGFDGCRLVVLGDLHTASFGADNEKLFRTVREQEPDYIVLVGDLLDCFHQVPPGYAERTAEELNAIAPTFYVTGNHEWAIGEVPALKETLRTRGITVLDNRYLELERNGSSLILAGIDDPNGYADQKTPEQLASELYADRGDPFWILLAHRNDRFPGQYSRLGADLVISGHGHGGLVRLPFTDGLVSTDRTFFPSFTAGLYEANGSALFVTRGLGNSGSTFRVFNRPEVAVVTLRRSS